MNLLDKTLKLFNLKRIPLSPEVVEDVKKAGKLQFVKEWTCTFCLNDLPLKLRISSRIDRDHGPSNFAGVYPEGHPVERLRGHSILPSSQLNWAGLAEERGWKIIKTDFVDEVICPPCQLGLTLEKYKLIKNVSK